MSIGTDLKVSYFALPFGSAQVSVRSSDGEEIKEGSVIEIEAQPIEGYKFSNWSVESEVWSYCTAFGD